MAPTQTITSQRMKIAGVSQEDQIWYFTKARPRGFSAPGDAERARKIIEKTVKVLH